MTTPQVKIVDAETGEETLRDMTAEELSDLAIQVKEREDLEAAQMKAAKDKAALLLKIGLTEDEARLLLS